MVHVGEQNQNMKWNLYCLADNIVIKFESIHI